MPALTETYTGLQNVIDAIRFDIVTAMSGIATTNANKQNAIPAGTAGVAIGYSGTSGTVQAATKLGTSTVGSTTTPIYLNAGVPTAITGGLTVIANRVAYTQSGGSQSNFESSYGTNNSLYSNGVRYFAEAQDYNYIYSTGTKPIIIVTEIYSSDTGITASLPPMFIETHTNGISQNRNLLSSFNLFPTVSGGNTTFGTPFFVLFTCARYDSYIYPRMTVYYGTSITSSHTFRTYMSVFQ